MPSPGEITQLLIQADQGCAQAADHLYRLVENDLKAIARKRRRGFPSDLDASATLLVNEAFCRLVGQKAADWQAGDRRKFFAYVATKIHNSLVNAVRAEEAQKRGGGWQQVGLDEGQAGALDGNIESAQLLIDLQTALDRFHEFAENDSILFRIRYFLNCTFEETAEIMGVSLTEAKRSYQRTRLWLQRELRSYHDDA